MIVWKQMTPRGSSDNRQQHTRHCTDRHCRKGRNSQDMASIPYLRPLPTYPLYMEYRKRRGSVTTRQMAGCNHRDMYSHTVIPLYCMYFSGTLRKFCFRSTARQVADSQLDTEISKARRQNYICSRYRRDKQGSLRSQAERNQPDRCSCMIRLQHCTSHQHKIHKHDRIQASRNLQGK
jgi:hypothetical protein